MMDEHKEPAALLVFGIGPVQDFIATARRTQDLWMGSYILSYLIAEAMLTFEDDLRRIIFPTAVGQPLLEQLRNSKHDPDSLLALAALPNKFTARVDSEEEGKQRAEAAERRVYDAWYALTRDIAAKFPARLATPTPTWEQIWEEQIKPEHWMELYWVVLPGADFEKAEQVFEARKRVRQFVQFEERGEKCTVCGTRIALSFQPNQPRSQLRQEWAALAKKIHELDDNDDRDYKGLGAALSGEGDERLCAICASKRFVQRFYFEGVLGLQGGFPSTSSVASVTFRKELLAKVDRRQRDTFVRILQGASDKKRQRIPETLAINAFPGLQNDPLLKYDGDLFFYETYTRKRLLDDYAVEVDEARLSELKGAIGRLRGAAKDAGIDRPCKYYAVLLMDGDDMGAHLRDAHSEAGYRKISKDLQDFALEKVKPSVEGASLGRVVYAGGDDLMAFLPLETALNTADMLRAEFESVTGGFTMSAGLAIAHHLAPLDLVLAAARKAEHDAKHAYGRKAMAVSVLKRSGEQLDVGAPWQANGVRIVNLVTDMTARFKSGDVSPKFAFDAESEARALTGIDPITHQKMLERLLKRHSRKANDIPAQLAQVAQAFRALGSYPANLTSPTVETARWLLLARFIAAALIGEE